MSEINCPNCKDEVSQIEFKCENCGYPLDGTDKEKAKFIGMQIANKSKIGDAKESQNRVKIIILIAAIFQFWNAFLIYKNAYTIEDFIFFIVLGIILAVLSFLSPKNPVLFISIALGILLVYYFLLYLINPMYLVNGIIWKVVIIISLFYGLIYSYEELKLKKKFNYLHDKKITIDKYSLSILVFILF